MTLGPRKTDGQGISAGVLGVVHVLCMLLAYHLSS